MVRIFAKLDLVLIIHVPQIFHSGYEIATKVISLIDIFKNLSQFERSVISEMSITIIRYSRN